MESSECGGKDFAKKLILTFLETFGRCNLRLLETITGLPWWLLKALLSEMEAEGATEHAGVYWSRR